jgi:hypothetical protein
LSKTVEICQQLCDITERRNSMDSRWALIPSPNSLKGPLNKEITQQVLASFLLPDGWREESLTFIHPQNLSGQRCEMRGSRTARVRLSTNGTRPLTPLSGFFLSFSRILGGCKSAQAVGLIDVQGKVNGAAGAFEPITFFDIHTTQPPSSPHAHELVEVITEWGTKP